MDNKAMFKIGYGLYVLTASDNGKDNGCIINTAMQVTSTPNRISVTVNKQNYTHDIIAATGVFNVSVLSQEANFEMFKRFGFQSGRDVDKFANYGFCKKAPNGIYYISNQTNAYISGKVEQSIDLGTHTMFIAAVTDAQVLSDAPTVTYDFYQKEIKPKPAAQETKGGYRCKICGYVYEGDVLPEDFVCPICKHGAADFEKI